MKQCGTGAAVIALGLALGVHAPDVHAEEVETLSPASEWTLRKAADKCRLSRSFGDGENRTSLRIDQSGIEPYYSLTIVGPSVRNPYGNVLHIQFGPNEATTQRGYISARSASGKPAIVMYGVLLAPVSALEAEQGAISSIGEEREAAIEWLSLSRSVVSPVRFDLGSMGDPLRDLRSCAANVARELETARTDTSGEARTPRPASNPGQWITSSDYPRDLVQRGMDGLITFRLTVNRNGKPTACYITASNRPQMFDDTVCLALMKRATFEPALDDKGNPRASYFTAKVRFQIP